MPDQNPTRPLLPYEWPGSYYYGDEELAAVTDVVRSRSPYRFYGPNLRGYASRLESAYCERLGRKHALAVNSGTAALSGAMAAIGAGPGDEILIPGYLWVSCVGAVVRAGAIPRLVDIDDTFCMDPEDLDTKIGDHSRAVLLVHMSGAPGAVDRIASICRARNLFLIEDCAQANGATFHGKPVGAFGDLAIFSFQLNKNITGGEGGLLVCDDERLFRRAWGCHDLGYPRTSDGRLDAGDPECQLWGQGSRCPELVAAAVHAQVAKLNTITAEMRRRKYLLRSKLAGIPGLSFRRILDCEGDSGPFLILVWKNRDLCLEMTERTRVAGVRTGELGINNIPMTGWGLHIYSNIPSLTEKRSLSRSGRPWTDPLNAFAQAYDYRKGALPATDALIARSSLLAIPPVLSETAIEDIGSAFATAAREIAPVALSGQ